MPCSGCSSSRFVVIWDYSLHLSSHSTPVISRLPPPPATCNTTKGIEKGQVLECRCARHLTSSRSFGPFLWLWKDGVVKEDSVLCWIEAWCYQPSRALSTSHPSIEWAVYFLSTLCKPRFQGTGPHYQIEFMCSNHSLILYLTSWILLLRTKSSTHHWPSPHTVEVEPRTGYILGYAILQRQLAIFYFYNRALWRKESRHHGHYCRKYSASCDLRINSSERVPEQMV